MLVRDNYKSTPGIYLALWIISFGVVQNAFGWWDYSPTPFIKDVFQRYHEIGAVAPCTRFVANEIVRYIDTDRARPLRILEAGGGNGVFTKKIVDRMRPDDVLDVIEINEDFCHILEERFSQYDNVHIHCISIADWHPKEPYDVIICSLPFTILPIDLVQKTLDNFQELINPDGIVSYIEYIATAQIRELFLIGDNKREFIEKRKIVQNFKDSFGIETKRVLRNIPPTYVHHCQITKRAA